MLQVERWTTHRMLFRPAVYVGKHVYQPKGEVWGDAAVIGPRRTKQQTTYPISMFRTAILSAQTDESYNCVCYDVEVKLGAFMWATRMLRAWAME